MSKPCGEPPVPPALLLAVKGAAFLSSLALLGFHVYGGNNELQLPMVQQANHPSLYPGDPFVATLPHYSSVLWHVLWIPFRFLPELPLLLLLTVLHRLFFLFAAGRLARAFSGGDPIIEATTWCLFAFGIAPFLGWGTVLSPFFDHTSLAVACWMLSLSFLIEGKPLRAGAALGVAGLVNVMHATQGLVLLLGVVALSPDLRTRWSTLRGGLLSLLVMSPAVYLAAKSINQANVPPEVFLRLLWFYFPPHFFPSSWSARNWIFAGLGFAFVLLALLFGRVHGPKRLVLGMTVGHLLVLLVAWAAEALRDPVLVNLQLVRSSDLWTPVAGVFVIATLVKAMGAAPARARMQIFGGAGLTAALLVWSCRRFEGPLLLLSVPACLAVVWLARSRWPYLVRSAPVLPLLWPTVLWSTWSLLGPPAHTAPFQERSEDEWEITQWAERHTSADAGFLVDPSWSAFRMLSRRNSFVTWKEGAAVLWSQPFAIEWVRRLRAVGVDPLDRRLAFPASLAALSQAFARIDDRRAMYLARTYGLHYWIVARDKRSGLPIAYQNAIAKALVLSQTDLSPVGQ